MLDLTKKSLPNTINVGGKDFSIYTDFRVWLKFIIFLQKRKVLKNTDLSFLFKNDMPFKINIQDLIKFAIPEQKLPRNIKTSDEKVVSIDYEIDSDYIFSSFLEQYGIDLIEIEDLHWHKFLALLRGTKGTFLADIISYRNYRKDTRKDVDHYEELKEAWEIVPEPTEEEKQALEEFSRMFGGD